METLVAAIGRRYDAQAKAYKRGGRGLPEGVEPGGDTEVEVDLTAGKVDPAALAALGIKVE